MTKPSAFSCHAFALTIGLLLASAHAQAATTYRVDELHFHAIDMNSSGTIVGTWSPNVDDLVVYSNGVITALNMQLSGKPAISDNGLISIRNSMVYDTRTGQLNGSYVNIGGGVGSNEVVTTGINNDGSIVGYVVDHDQFGQSYATLVKNGQLTVLPGLGGPTTATAINNHGLIVGSSQTEPQYSASGHAYKYDGTTGTDLGVLPGGIASYASAVNDAGRVVGASLTTSDWSDNKSHAFITSSSGLVDLGVLAGYTRSDATDINNLGQVVGYSGKIVTDVIPGGSYSYYKNRAFLYSDADGLQDLNTLLDGTLGQDWVLESAQGISDDGIIFGKGLHNGVRTEFLMRPVPEPETIALVVGGLCVVALARRKGRAHS